LIARRNSKLFIPAFKSEAFRCKWLISVAQKSIPILVVLSFKEKSEVALPAPFFSRLTLSRGILSEEKISLTRKGGWRSFIQS